MTLWRKQSRVSHIESRESREMSFVVLTDKQGCCQGDLRTKGKEVRELTMWIFNERCSRQTQEPVQISYSSSRPCITKEPRSQAWITQRKTDVMRERGGTSHTGRALWTIFKCFGLCPSVNSLKCLEHIYETMWFISSMGCLLLFWWEATKSGAILIRQTREAGGLK